jgi:hypothetical protein
MVALPALTRPGVSWILSAPQNRLLSVAKRTLLVRTPSGSSGRVVRIGCSAAFRVMRPLKGVLGGSRERRQAPNCRRLITTTSALTT